jgi:hypothetical protein
MTPGQASADYAFLQTQASIAEAGGLAKERSVLLLWHLRNVVGLDDLDAYEFVCDGDQDQGVDGLYLEPSSGDEDHETLEIFQSKYTTSPSLVGETEFGRLLATAANFKNVDSLRQMLTPIPPLLVEILTDWMMRSKEDQYT